MSKKNKVKNIDNDAQCGITTYEKKIYVCQFFFFQKRPLTKNKAPIFLKQCFTCAILY